MRVSDNKGLKRLKIVIFLKNSSAINILIIFPKGQMIIYDTFIRKLRASRLQL